MSRDVIKNIQDKTVIRTDDATTLVREDKGNTRILNRDLVTKVVKQDQKTIIREGPLAVSLDTVVTPQKQIHLQYTAQYDIEPYRAVTTNTFGNLIYANPTDANHQLRILGISTDFIYEGQLGGVICHGEIESSEWNWSIEELIYIGSDGQLQTTPPNEGFQAFIGFPISESRLYIRSLYQPRITSVYKTLSDDDILEQFVELEFSPQIPYDRNVSVNVIGGIEQLYNVDFAVIDHNHLTWDPTYVEDGLDVLLDEGDILHITYVY